jgi:hypothetical protein
VICTGRSSKVCTGADCCSLCGVNSKGGKVLSPVCILLFIVFIQFLYLAILLLSFVRKFTVRDIDCNSGIQTKSKLYYAELTEFHCGKHLKENSNVLLGVAVSVERWLLLPLVTLWENIVAVYWKFFSYLMKGNACSYYGTKQVWVSYFSKVCEIRIILKECDLTMIVDIGVCLCTKFELLK